MKTIIKVTILFLFVTVSTLVTRPLFADSSSGSLNILTPYSSISAPAGLTGFLPAGLAAYGKSTVPGDPVTANVTGDSIDSTCFNNTGVAGADAVTFPTGTSTTPYGLILETSKDVRLYTTLPTWWVTPTAPNPPSYQTQNTVPYSGYYYISVTLIIEQFQADAVYFWVDDWATTTATTTLPGTNIRLFYSGDVPYSLNGASGSIFTVSFSGMAYLPAGSTIYSPRIWTTEYDPISTSTPQAAPMFCILNSNGTPISYSTIYATLVKTP